MSNEIEAIKDPGLPAHVHRKADVDPKYIYEAMVTGPQSMPVFSDKTITPAEKLSIIKWIKSAESEPNLGGASLGRVGPVTEGLLGWVLGLGILIGVAVWLAMKAR